MTNVSGANLNSGAAVGPQGEGRDSPSNFPTYSAYKDSGVEWLGEVPQHWVITKFSRHFSVRMGETIPETELSEDGWLPVYSATERDRFSGYVDERKPLVEIGDLVIPARGNSIGFVKLVKASATATQTTIVANVLDRKLTESSYVYYWCLGLRRVLFYFDRTAIPQITTEYVSRNPLPLPPLAEQTQIARFLDHETARIDALIEEQQRLIELLKEKRQAVISHAVTKGLDPTVPMKDSGVEWLGKVPAHWQIGALKHFISPVPGAIKTGPFGSHLKSEDMKEGPYKVFNQRSVIDADFSAGDNFISEEKFAELRGFTAFPGDVLVTTRGTIGRAAILPDNTEVGILHPCLLRVQVDESKITSSYLCRLIQESHLLKTQLSLMSNSTTIEVIYSETMANLFIPVPPITEQGQIAVFLDDVICKVGALTNDANESVRLLQERRSALISAAVTGKIDVRGWQPPASTPSAETAVAEVV